MPERLWFNALWFQATWFCTVLGRDRLLALTLAMLALHLWLVRDRVLELKVLLPVALTGMAVDSLLSLVGVYQFSSSGPIPLWLCGLWLAFATTLSRSLGFLCRSAWLAGLVGIVVPVNYLAGERLGAVEFGLPLGATLPLLALVWAALLPTLCYITVYLRETPRRAST